MLLNIFVYFDHFSALNFYHIAITFPIHFFISMNKKRMSENDFTDQSQSSVLDS